MGKIKKLEMLSNIRGDEPGMPGQDSFGRGSNNKKDCLMNAAVLLLSDRQVIIPVNTECGQTPAVQ